MDVREYRRQYEAQLAAHAATARTAAALSAAPEGGSGDRVHRLLATLRNDKESASARIAALYGLQAAEFLAARFAPYHADFLAALREIVRPGTDPELCEGALETLALEKDSYAQDVLRRGLTDAKAALVSPAKALQFLSYDDHSGVVELARDIFHKATDLGTKEEALRVLASDPKSADLFTSLIGDKSQPRSIRALSATGLNFLSPQRFVEAARAIAPDDHDYDDIRATVIGALAHLADAADLPKDQNFLQSVQEIGAKTASANVRSAVGRFMKRLQE